MNSSKLIMGLIVSLFFGTIINAQDLENIPNDRSKKRMEKKHKRFGKLAGDLNLNAQQEKEVFALMKEARSERKKLRGDHGHLKDMQTEERKSIKTKHKELKSKLDAEIMTVLDEEQRLKYKDIIAAGEKKMKERALKMETLRTYRKEKIKPVLLEQRMKLESVISTEDKALIRDLQSRINPRAMIGRRGKGNKDSRNKSMMAKDDRDTLKSLVETYKEDIDALHEEITEKETEWKSFRKSLKPMKDNDGQFREDRRGKRVKNKARKGKHRYAAFLLMDINS